MKLSDNSYELYLFDVTVGEDVVKGKHEKAKLKLFQLGELFKKMEINYKINYVIICHRQYCFKPNQH
jgi:hypothetical protein